MDLIVWGNHSPTMFPNFEEATSFDIKVTKLVKDKSYFKNEFIKRVSKRGGEVIKVKGFSSVFPAGKALCDHLHDWYHGNEENVSMAVCSDGSYGLEKGIYCSLPVLCKGNFEYEIDKTVKLSEYGKGKLGASHQELLEEKKAVLNAPEPKL